MVARNAGQRAGLSRAHVLDAGRELIAAHGSSGLTMRAVAGRLGVAPNALYTYVTSKDGLVDELLDDALAEVSAPADTDVDPAAGLSLVMTSTYQVLLRQRDLVPLYLARQGARGSNARRLGDVMTNLLERAGVPATARQPAVRVLIIYTIGCAAFATQSAHDSGGPGLSADVLEQDMTDGLGWLLAGILGAAGPSEDHGAPGQSTRAAQ